MTATEQRHKQLWNAWPGQMCVHLNRYNTICTTKGAAYVSSINDMWIQPAFDINVALKHFLSEIISSLFIIIKTAGTYIKMTPFRTSCEWFNDITMIRLTNLRGYSGLIPLWRDWTFYIQKTNTRCLLYINILWYTCEYMHLWEYESEYNIHLKAKFYFTTQ